MISLLGINYKNAIKFLLALLVTLTLFSTTKADFYIDKKDHIANVTPGRCAWCSLETLGRTLGWKSLEGCRDRNSQDAFPKAMIEELNKQKVKYRVNWPKENEQFYHLFYAPKGKSEEICVGIRRSHDDVIKLLKSKQEEGTYWIDKQSHQDISFLTKTLNDGLGVAIIIGKGADCHMLVVVGMNDQTVRMVDSNYKPGEIRIEPMHWLIGQWNGFAIALERP